MDLDGKMLLSQEMFCKWYDFGRRTASRCPCAAAVRRYAVDHQAVDMRGSVDGDTAWELCCRELERAVDAQAMFTHDLASLLVHWFEEAALPADTQNAVYQGMLAELQERGKTVETLSDEQAMKVRWVRQVLHGELAAAQTAEPDLSVELE